MKVITTKINFVAAVTNNVAGSTKTVATATKKAAASKVYKEVNRYLHRHRPHYLAEPLRHVPA